DQRGNVLVVLVTGFGLGNGDLIEDGWIEFYDFELADVAPELSQTLGRPGRHDGAQVASGNTEVFLENRSVFSGVEQPQRRLENRRNLDRVERHFRDQLFEVFSQP